VFRRENCPDNSITLPLCGLEPEAHYELTNFDVKGSTKIVGRELMEKGLKVEVDGKPWAVVITYHKIK